MSESLLLLPGRGCAADSFTRAAHELGYAHVEVVSSAVDAVRAISKGPAVAVFPIDADRIGGRRIELALHAANPTTALVGFGAPVSESVRERLSLAGVQTYLHEPLDYEHIVSGLPSVEPSLDEIHRAVRAVVGRYDLLDTLRVVRFAMCDEALSRASGSRRAAARLLGVDRRAVQKLVDQMRELERYDLRAVSERGPGKIVRDVNPDVGKIGRSFPLTGHEASAGSAHHEGAGELRAKGLVLSAAPINPRSQRY